MQFVRALQVSCLFNDRSIFLLLSNLPSETLNNALGSIFGADNIAKLGYLLEPTFNIMALLVIIGIAKSLWISSY